MQVKALQKSLAREHYFILLEVVRLGGYEVVRGMGIKSESDFVFTCPLGKDLNLHCRLRDID